MRVSLVVLAALLLASPRTASGQVSTAPAPLGAAFEIARPYADLDEFTRLYNGGEWDALQRQAQTLLAAARAVGKAQANGAAIDRALDVKSHYVIAVWIGTDPFGKSMLARVVVHTPAAAEPFSADLPGVGARSDGAEVYEAFLSRGVRGKLISVYASSRDKDPVADALPAFVQAIASPLFAAFGTFAGPASKTVKAPLTEGAVRPPSVAITVSRVGLPFERATIKWKASAKEPAEIDAFVDATGAFVQDLVFSEVPNSMCARAVAAALGAALTRAAASDTCVAATATMAGCRALFDRTIRETEERALDARAPAPACASPSKDDLTAVDKADNKVRAFAAAAMTNGSDGELTFKNRPLTHWGFGAGSGVLTTAALTRPRVKVKDETFVSDPLPRVVTTSFVNWSPAGYDGGLDAVSAAERVRPFFGVTLTPDFGVAAGFNLLVVRGIGITAGGVLMFAKGGDADRIGKARADPDKPYDVSCARGLVLGISYNFK